jgi:DNA-binding transcriptional LysR family regulator
MSFHEKEVLAEVKELGDAMEKYRVSLTDEERGSLEGLLGKGKGAARRLAHARILLLADAGEDDDAIADAVAVSTRTVNRVRKRLVTEGFLAALDHKPQPPRPDQIKIKGDVEQELVRIACTDPPTGRCHWTLQLLADELVTLGLVKEVSTETVRQALKKTASTRGSWRAGASRPTRTASTSGTWRT